MLKSKKSLVTSEYNSQRFDTVAAELFEDMSRKKIKAIIDAGGAYINKRRVIIAKTLVKTGDKIEIFWEENAQNLSNPSSHSVTSVNKTLGTYISKETCIFENEDFFIINKPAGISSQATLTSDKDSIIFALNKFDENKFNLKKMFLVHRLDKETSGLMIIAKNQNYQNIFENLFRDKKINKTYDAICYFTPKNMEGEINFPIAKDNARKNCYFAVTNIKSKIKDQKQSSTYYKVTKVFKNNEASLIRCNPKTGRTHQIRVHLSAIGCPLLGDKTYSQNIYGHRFSQIAIRHMLHASELEFEVNGKIFHFTSKLPEDFLRIINALE